ncbi:MAG: hypothetical protein K0R50_1884 [Eubacterium sp.]|jgi:hypothetical protein|nr:hypothetical protein [Eubacterium sp.]
MPNNWSENPYMHMMNIPKQYEPMMEMPQEQLESMFPRSYYIIYPEVSRHCDRMISKHGTMFTPSRQQLEDAIDDIDNRVGQDIEAEYADDDNDNQSLESYQYQKDNDYDNLESYQYQKGNDYEDLESYQYGKDKGDRQIGFFGGFPGRRRRFRRDLISIILLRELLRRRRRPHHGHGGFGPGGFGFPGTFGF